MSAIRTLIEAIDRGDAPPHLFRLAFPDDPEAARLAEAAYMDGYDAAKAFVRLKLPADNWTIKKTAVVNIKAAFVGSAVAFSDSKARALLLAALEVLEEGRG